MMLFKSWIFRSFSCFQNFRYLIIMLKTRHRKLTNLMFVFRFKKKIEILHRVSNFFERFYVFVIQNDILIALFIDRVKKNLFFIRFAIRVSVIVSASSAWAVWFFFFDENFFVFVEFSVSVLNDFRNVLISIFLIRVQNFALKKILFSNFWIRFVDSSLFQDFFSYVFSYLNLFRLKYFLVLFLIFSIFIWLWTFRTIFSLIRIWRSKLSNVFSFCRMKMTKVNWSFRSFHK